MHRLDPAHSYAEHNPIQDAQRKLMLIPRSLSPTNWDILRLLAVGIVVVGNGLVLTGGVPPGLWGAPMPRIGLDLLFSIAGYMSAELVRSSASPATFLLGRARRVFPALVTSVVLTAFMLGPFATTLPHRVFLLAVETRRYLYNIILMPQPFLPRTFEGQQWSGATNPILWTLDAYAVGCVAVLMLSRQRRAALGALALAAVFAILALIWPTTPQALPHLLQRSEFADAMPEMPFFFVAAALSFLGRPHLWRADLAMFCFAVTWIVATWVDRNTIVLLWLTLPYMAICFGRMTLPGLTRVWRFGNPSYGAFLYAFPLQQFIVSRWPEVKHPILICLAASAVLGLLSWHLVEYPALRWRSAARTARVES